MQFTTQWVLKALLCDSHDTHIGDFTPGSQQALYSQPVFPLKDYQLGPTRQNLNYFRGLLSQNFQFLLKNRLIYQEKASFLHNVTKSVEPIFQGLEPIVRHRALKGTLLTIRDQKPWARNMERFWFLGVGGNRSTQRKPTKVGMESANQIHVQPLAVYAH